MPGSSGIPHEFEVLLPQFGCSHGMLLHPTYDAEAFAAATKAGYGVAILDAEPEPSVDASLLDAIECLFDWGWFGTSPPPPWYSEREERARDNAVHQIAAAGEGP